MGTQKPGFLRKDALEAADSLKSPVSLVVVRKCCSIQTHIPHPELAQCFFRIQSPVGAVGSISGSNPPT
jgi:hypothetical protein